MPASEGPTGGAVLAPEGVTHPHTRDRDRLSTLMEGSITHAETGGSTGLARTGERPSGRGSERGPWPRASTSRRTATLEALEPRPTHGR